MNQELPFRAAALHPDWPEARFNVSGMFVFHPIIVQLMGMVELGFDCRLPIEAVHGAPSLKWNAGRASRVPYNVSEFEKTLPVLYSRDIGYFPTFTNHLVGPQDLADPVGNNILDHLNQRPDLNAVIVNSELLSQYIAQHYPKVRQVASIIKVTLENGRGRPDYYRSLGDRFWRYVVHPDDCRDLRLLDQLDREKAEIIINENCAVDCPSRVGHYQAYAKWQAAADVPDQQIAQQEINQYAANCHSPFHINRLSERKRSCNLARSEMKAVYDLGFRHFKIQGRADDPYSYSYDLIRFFLEPEAASPLIFKSLCRWLDKVLVKTTA